MYPSLLRSILTAQYDMNLHVSRQWLGKHVPVAMKMHATIEALLEIAFSAQSVLR